MASPPSPVVAVPPRLCRAFGKQKELQRHRLPFSNPDALHPSRSNPSILGARRRAALFIAASAAIAVAACSSENGAPSGATSSASTAAAATSAIASSSGTASAAPRETGPAPSRQGSALARTIAGDAVYVADEDHGVV